MIDGEADAQTGINLAELPAEEIQELLDERPFEEDMDRLVCLLYRIASRIISIQVHEITLDDLCGNPVLYLDMDRYRLKEFIEETKKV